MRKIFLISFLCSLFLLTNSITFGQSDKEYLVLKVKVDTIQESDFAPDVTPSENSYLVIGYDVLKVCDGNYKEFKIKIAHFGDTRHSRIGDEMSIKVELTNRFRETAESALEIFGVIIPEESLADFVFVDANQSCSHF